MGNAEILTWSSLALAAITLATALIALRQALGGVYKRAWLMVSLALVTFCVAGAFIFYSIRISAIPQIEQIAAAAGLAGAVLLASGLFDLSRQLARQRVTDEMLKDKMTLLLQGFNGASELLVIKDKNGIYVAANQAYADFLGKSVESLLGHSDYDYFPRSLANLIKQEEERLLAGGAEKEEIEELHGAVGLRSLRVRREVLKDAAGKFSGILMAAQDITAWSQDTAQLKQDNRALLELHAATSRLVRGGYGAELYKTILESASRLAGSEHVCLWLVDEDSKTLFARAGAGKLTDLGDLRLKPGDDLPGKVWQSGQEAFAADYSSVDKRHPSLEKLGFSSAAAAPIKADTDILGVLGVYYAAEKKGFSKAILANLCLFAAIAAAALERAGQLAAREREYEERNQALTQYQYRLRLERLVSAIAARFIQIPAPKIDEAITRSLQSMAKFTGADRVFIALLPGDDHTKSAKFAGYSSQPGDNLVELAHPDSPHNQWLLGRLSQLEMVHIVKSAEKHGDSEDASIFLNESGNFSFTAIPMIANRSLVGCFALENKTKELEWSPEILSLFKICAEMYVSVLERKWSAEDQQAHLKKADLDKAALERRAEESALIAEIGDLLQACRTADEAYPIIARYASRLLPQTSGALYLVRHAADPAEKVVSWGDAPPGPSENDVGPNDCWGLRRGRLHSVLNPESEPICAHVHEPYPASYLCVPLIAQGASAGVLHLRQTANQAAGEPLSVERQQLASRVAEYIALALANLNLRDTLRSQAIRDPLTGLFNRRYMEETLDREIRRASRHGTSVGIIMFDIDRMKPINDTFGHDAGDLLLRTLGGLMLNSFRGEDVACRYGGDEFTIVLPEASLVDVWRRAEQLRENVKKLDIRYEGRSVGAITLSIGVAAYPDHGLTAERVLLAADAASYASKSEGGDRIVVGHEAETQE